tara:strand:- start:375 stop:1226 length:852 start_codon:yes stop_codon:yes gene_type:complete
MRKYNKSITTIIFCILIIVFTALIIRYFLNKQENYFKEGLENNKNPTNLIITLNSDIDVPIDNPADEGNGIPSKYDYEITSISSDGTRIDERSTIFKDNTPQQVPLESINTDDMESARNQGSFIIISPKTADVFPDSFKFKIENNIQENKLQFDLWGDTYMNENEPRPTGNSNTIVGPHNLSGYILSPEDEGSSAFSYNKIIFSDSCFKKSGNDCIVNKLNIGNNIINVIQSGGIFDNKGQQIGHAKKTNRQKQISMDTIEVDIENYKGVTGLLLYIGHTTKV